MHAKQSATATATTATATHAPAPPSETATAPESATASATASAAESASAAPDESATAEVASAAPSATTTATTAARVYSGNLFQQVQEALQANDNGRALVLAQQLATSASGSADAWLMLAAAQIANGINPAGTYKQCAQYATSGNVKECKALAGM
jgi:hypothetical protein